MSDNNYIFALQMILYVIALFTVCHFASKKLNQHEHKYRKPQDS